VNKAQHEIFMRKAIKNGFHGMMAEHGGPFGAVIVRDYKILGEGYNRVLLDNDPTAHAEITAIRDACSRINAGDLSGAILYSSSFPCPMCMSAIFFARISKIYYCCSVEDTSEIGFDDQEFYQQLDIHPRERKTAVVQLTDCYDEALQCFVDWLERKDDKSTP